MKLEHNDKVLIFFVKYAPIFFVIILSLFTTEIVLLQKEQNFKREIQEIKKNYYNTNKERIQEEIDKVFTYIKKEKQSANEKLKESIKQRVYEAHTIATNIYNNEIKRHTKDEVFEIIKNTLGSITFNNGRGYFFMIDVKGNTLLQPLNQQFEGKNFSKYKDKNGYSFFKTIKEVIDNKTEKYDSYYWYKNTDTTNTYKKTSFYKYFEPFDIIIGTGEYVQEFENELKDKILSKLHNLRYSDNKYIFVINYDGVYLAHYRDDLVGVNRYNYKNEVGKFLAKDLINFAKDGGGYISYVDTINAEKFIENNEKTSFVKKFDDWRWVIGTGFYTEKLNKIIEEKTNLLQIKKDKSVKDIVLLSIFTTLVLLIISFFISKVLEKRLLTYKKKIEKKIVENREKDNIMFQQSKMAIMGEMIANIAHQWRQPLSQISTVSSGVKMQEELGILNKEELHSNMNSINNSVQYLSRTIDDFRNFFSPSKSYENFKIENTIEKTLNLVKSQFESNEIDIIKDIQSCEINSLENEVSQVLINILKNAKDALVENNKNERKLIVIKTFKDENSLNICIQDNAKGIPQNILKNIFDPYFTTKDKEGTGIGLFMSKNILEKNIYGKLEVENSNFTFDGETYKGAKFIMKIPINLEHIN